MAESEQKNQTEVLGGNDQLRRTIKAVINQLAPARLDALEEDNAYFRSSSRVKYPFSDRQLLDRYRTILSDVLEWSDSGTKGVKFGNTEADTWLDIDLREEREEQK